MYTSPPHRHLLCGVARISRNAPVLTPVKIRFMFSWKSGSLAPSHFSQFQFSISFSQFSSVQFSYATKPGGPEWGERRLRAAPGVSRAVQTGAKDLDLSAAS